MCIRNRLVSLIYKLLLVFVSGWGLFLYSGLPEGALNLSAFKYYTILSNCLVFIFFIVSAVYTAARMAKKGVRGVSVFAPHFKGAVMMAIIVTLLIYQFLLAPRNFIMPGTSDALRNNIVHLYVPIMVVVDWLLFDRKGRFTIGDPFYWLAIPLLYWAWSIAAALLGVTYIDGSRYPYFFINTDEYGWLTVLRNVGLLLLGFLALGFILYGIDKLLGALIKKPKEAKVVTFPDGEEVDPASISGGKNVYKAGDAPKMSPADSVIEVPEPSPIEKDVIIVEAASKPTDLNL